jgi:hypothetical protein
MHEEGRQFIPELQIKNDMDQNDMNQNDMDQNDKIMEGLEIAYKRLIEFKKYKKTPVVIFKDGKVVELDPHKIDTSKNVYKK